MRRLADELGIAAPSLYKHISGRDEILALLQASGLEEFGRAVAEATAGEPAGGGGDIAAGGIAAMAATYRTWALHHAALYSLMTRRPLDRGRLPEGLEATAEAPLLAAVGQDRATARALWAVAHGLVDLELAGRFPVDADLDAAWAAAVRAFTPG